MPYSCISSYPNPSGSSRSNSSTTSKPSLSNQSKRLGDEHDTRTVKRFPPIQQRYLRKPIFPSSYPQSLIDRSILPYQVQTNYLSPDEQVNNQAPSHKSSPLISTTFPTSLPTSSTSLHPVMYEDATSSSARRLHPKSSHSCSTENQTTCSENITETVKNIDFKNSDGTTELSHDSSPEIHSSSETLPHQADPEILPRTPTESTQKCNPKLSSKVVMKCPPRAKAFIFRNHHEGTLQSYVRSNKVPVQLIDCTGNLGNDSDDIAKKFCDNLKIFDEDNNEKMNPQPKSDDQIQPEAVGFSLHTQMELLREMKQIGCGMMDEGNNIPSGIRRDVPKFRNAGGTNRWKSWRSIFRRFRKNNVSNVGGDTNPTDRTSTYAADIRAQVSDKGKNINNKTSSRKHSRSIRQVLSRLLRKRNK